jgi:hypothetical protein
MRRLVPILAAVGLLTGLAAAPSSAAATTTLNPAKLPRGADVSIPHLEKKTIVDGAVRVTVNAPTVRLLGKSGAAYVVATANKMGGGGRVLRVAADGTTTKLARANAYMTELSGDGLTLVSTKIHNRKSTVKVLSATTGAVVASHEFKGYISTLDAETDRVLVGSIQKTWLWTTSTDSVAVVSRLGGYEGDLSADVFAGYTKDPYDGGCSIVRRISTGEQLWKSCRERVQTFNADGSRMATIDLLSDGIGPSYVAVRSGTGQKLGAYQVKNGWFGEIKFETSTAVLLQANGVRRSATVRCTDTGCERASDLTPTVHPRVS